jgi:hypothetical protein
MLVVLLACLWHLPGQHDQREHGNWSHQRATGGRSIPRAIGHAAWVTTKGTVRTTGKAVKGFATGFGGAKESGPATTHRTPAQKHAVYLQREIRTNQYRQMIANNPKHPYSTKAQNVIKRSQTQARMTSKLAQGIAEGQTRRDQRRR